MSTTPERRETWVDGFLDVETIARVNHMSTRLIRKLIADGLPHHRMSRSGKIWIRQRDLEQWITRRYRVEARNARSKVSDAARSMADRILEGRD